MEMGYGNREVIIKLSVDQDPLLEELLAIQEKAMEVSGMARDLIKNIQGKNDCRPSEGGLQKES